MFSDHKELVGAIVGVVGVLTLLSVVAYALVRFWVTRVTEAIENMTTIIKDVGGLYKRFDVLEQRAEKAINDGLEYHTEHRRRLDTLEARMQHVEKDLETDRVEIWRKLDDLAYTLQTVRDIVIKLDASKHREHP